MALLRKGVTYRGGVDICYSAGRAESVESSLVDFQQPLILCPCHNMRDSKWRLIGRERPTGMGLTYVTQTDEPTPMPPSLVYIRPPVTLDARHEYQIWKLDLTIYKLQYGFRPLSLRYEPLKYYQIFTIPEEFGSKVDENVGVL